MFFFFFSVIVAWLKVQRKIKRLTLYSGEEVSGFVPIIPVTLEYFLRAHVKHMRLDNLKKRGRNMFFSSGITLLFKDKLIHSSSLHLN